MTEAPKRNNNNHSSARPASGGDIISESGSAIISETRVDFIGISSHPVDHLMSLGHTERAALTPGPQLTAAGKVIYAVGALD